MKKNTFILIFLFAIGLFAFHGQNINEKDFNLNLNEFPQEKVYVHFNTTFLVAGESLFYKIYCLNADTNKLSNLSKIAYVELINSDRNTIFKHKIILKSGLGKGDFFIKASIPSGNYKLIAYTQWMRNKGETTFFQNDVTIINPFRANKRLTVKTENDQDTIIRNSGFAKDNFKPIIKPIKNEFIGLYTNKKTFGKREKVSLSIKGLKSNLSHGNYSISVKKVNAVDAPSKTNSKSFIDKNQVKESIKGSIFFLPELRGEIISGSVYFKNTNTTVPNVKVALSIPNKNSIFKIATTNKFGVFYFNINETFNGLNAIIQVIEPKKHDLSIEINKYEPPNYSDLVFNDFILTPELNDLILKKSISNQIENAYYSVKKDSIQPVKFNTPTYEVKAKTYNLNDYTKFKTLKETITEVVDAVYLLQKNREHTFHVKFYNNINQNNLLPLVLIDGVIIQNHNSIMDYNARSIKSIKVVRDKYIYGGQLFNGIIAIKTLNGDFNLSTEGSYVKKIELEKPQINKSYFKQEYRNSNLGRIPDFRNQLLWHPNLTLNSEEHKISFYTSDNTGNYEISLEGFTENGKPVTIKEFITVKN